MRLLPEEIDKSLAARLKRLLSEPIIIQKTGKGKLKVLDPNQRQSTSVSSTNPLIDRFRKLHIADRLYNSYLAGEIRMAKLNFYMDYEAMDQDPIISSALDIYSHESTTTNREGKMLLIESDNAKIKDILHNLFYGILKIEHNLPAWIRDCCKYGDFYLYLDLEEGIGIKTVYPITPYVIKREEGYDPEHPYLYRFVEDGAYNTSYMNSYLPHAAGGTYEAYEMAHFRLLQTTNFLPYGRSMIEPARKIYKQLSLLEDAMMLVRIMRAPERRIFYIDVGNLPAEDVDAYMEEIKNNMQKTPYIDRTTGEYNLKYNIMNQLEDYYIPVRGGQSGDKIETLPGLNSQGQIDDVEYIRKRMMAALKIPAAFLSYDDGVQGKSTLAAEDIRFARTVESIQKMFTSELKKMALIHLKLQGFKETELLNFDLKLNNPSIVFQRQQIDLLSEQLNVVSSIIETKIFSRQYMYENIFNLTEEQIKKIEKEIVEDHKLKFRLYQLENEGNDPNKTGESFGTPHDIAALNMTGKDQDASLDPDKKSLHKGDDPGRPERKGSYGTHDDINGFDPDGRKTIAKAMTGDSPEYNHKGKGPLDTEEFKQILQLLSKKEIARKKRAIHESLNDKENSSNNISFLDENNLSEY